MKTKQSRVESNVFIRWTTTLNEIEKHEPCAEGWKKLLSFLGKTKADDKPLHLLTILEANGAADAIWSLRAIEGHEREKALFAKEIRKALAALAADYAAYAAYDATLATDYDATLAADYAATLAADYAASAAYAATLDTLADYAADYAVRVAAEAAERAANAERLAQGELLRKMVAGEL